MLIEVSPKKMGDTFLMLTGQGFHPEIILDEDVPLGRNTGPVTGEELVMMALKHGQSTTKQVVEQFISAGKPRQSTYTALTALKKKGKIINPETGLWRLK